MGEGDILMTNSDKGHAGNLKIKLFRPSELRVDWRKNMHECMAPDETYIGCKIITHISLI